MVAALGDPLPNEYEVKRRVWRSALEHGVQPPDRPDPRRRLERLVPSAA